MNTETFQSIERAAQRVRDDEAALRAQVMQARVDGANWTQLGRALGVSRQAATQRFGTCPCGKPAEHVLADEESRDWPCRVPVSR